MKLELRNLSFSYPTQPVLKDINLAIAPEIVALIGPNGAGKSTLIKCIAGVLKPKGGILFEGKEIRSSGREFHRKIMSYLPQAAATHSVLTVFETVLLGMLNSLSFRVGEEVLEKVARVLSLLNIDDLAQRDFNELSGGQQQIASIAQAIVKDPQVMLLDEPLSSLDIRYQFEILNLLRDLTANRGMVTIVALHDLNLAARYADRIAVLNKGELYSFGPPDQVLTPETIREVYRVEARIDRGEDGIPAVYPVDVAM